MKISGVVVSCEHGGVRVPAEWRTLFAGAKAALSSHRGHDAGALDLARRIARALDAPLFAQTVTRLLVDANRTPRNPKTFSEFTRGLPAETKRRLIDAYQRPHAESVKEAVKKSLGGHGRVLHLSVHSFSPELDGTIRNADVGLLYDPARVDEKAFCRGLANAIRSRDPGLRVRMNYPYQGVSDGLTSWLRRSFPDGRYLGIELEANSGLLTGPAGAARAFRRALVESVRLAAAREFPD